MTSKTCDFWLRGSYCGDTTVRRYMNGWRCIKHIPAVIREAASLSNEMKTPT